MDIVTIQEQIEKRITWLDELLKRLTETGTALALAEAEYDRDLALAMLGIEHGSVKEIDGVPIGKVTTTTLRDKAKGVCWQARLKLAQAEAMHKGTRAKIETVSAQLNAFQSIFRHAELTAKTNTGV